MTQLTEKRITWITIAILALYPLVGMGVDLIAPSLPAISKNLGTTPHFSKNLIAFYLLGYMLGNFLIGFLSDSLGRRKLLLLGFVIFTIASLTPALIPLPWMLLLGRFLQGFTIAAFAVGSRAILSDVLSEEQLVRQATLLATMWGIGPIIGPLIGGYLQYYFNWHYCFYFYALMGLLGILAMIFIIPETHLQRQPLVFQQLKTNFTAIITHRLFLGVVIIMGVAYSLLIVFNTLGPFLIQDGLGYSSIFFGKIALLMGISFITGTILCRKILKKHSPEKLFLHTTWIFTLVALLAVGAAFVLPNSIWMIIAPSFLLFIASGMIYPAGMARGLSMFRHIAGSGSAVMNLVSIAITSLTAFIMSFIHVNTAFVLMLIYFALMGLALLVYYSFIKKN